MVRFPDRKLGEGGGKKVSFGHALLPPGLRIWA